MRVQVASFKVRGGHVRLAATAREGATLTVWGQKGDIGPFPFVPFVPPDKDGKPVFVKPVMWQGAGHHDFNLWVDEDMTLIVMNEVDTPESENRVDIRYVKPGKLASAAHAFGRHLRDLGWKIRCSYATAFGGN